jgi:hypothetical protein
MDITRFINTIKELVAQNKLELSIVELKNFMKNQEYYNEVVIQSARYCDIESQIRMNTVSKIDADIEKNKIRLAVLQIADNIQKHIIKSATNDIEKGKQNNIKIDGNGNIVLQDINGGTITVNYNDIEAIKTVLLNITSNQIIELKQIIASQNEEVLSEIRKIQGEIDKRNTENKINEYTADLDEFFKDLKMIKIEAAKKRILKDYEMLHETEDLLLLEEIPKRKKRYELDIKDIKANIAKEENELKNIINQK